jgi:hypothetical protein
MLEPFAGPGGRRVLVCADFGYGYPEGFASLLAGGDDTKIEPWRAVWMFLERHMRDDIGTAHGARPTNRSNRFEVASAINAAGSRAPSHGPFWCLFRAGSHPCIPQMRPTNVVYAGRRIADRRITDLRADSDTPFRLFGTGSVGSQVLTGIPRLQRLRTDPSLSRCSAVWPFETGWAPERGAWLHDDVRIVHAEIYPSVRDPLPDTIKDRGQVRAMWHWARELDQSDRLVAEFAIPAGVAVGSAEDETILREEGWILGCERANAPQWSDGPPIQPSVRRIVAARGDSRGTRRRGRGSRGGS